MPHAVAGSADACADAPARQTLTHPCTSCAFGVPHPPRQILALAGWAPVLHKNPPPPAAGQHPTRPAPPAAPPAAGTTLVAGVPTSPVPEKMQELQMEAVQSLLGLSSVRRL